MVAGLFFEKQKEKNNSAPRTIMEKIKKTEKIEDKRQHALNIFFFKKKKMT
jgi:hypothetical protein